MRLSRIMIVGAALAAVVAGTAVVGSAVGSVGPALSERRTGEVALADRLERALPELRSRAASCVFSDDGVRYAGFGADQRTRFEIGSITKTMTTSLVADAVDRGEVSLDDPLGAYLDLGDAPVAEVTLGELATHRSGLGEWGDDARDTGPTVWWMQDVRGGTVHDITMAELLDRARADALSSRGEYRYSNIGIALLGHAVAEAVGIDYQTLFERRLVSPLALRDTGITSRAAQNPPTGYREDGRRSPAWTLGAYAPSGGAYSTVEDLCAWAERVIEADRAPDALRPLDPVEGTGMGLAWEFDRRGDTTVAFKSGRTGGFASAIAIDVERGTAAVVLTDTAANVVDTAWALLGQAP